MRHRINGRRLNKDSEHRIAMLRNLAAGLFEHGEIRTTLPKAKAVQPLVERLISIAKRGAEATKPEVALAARRELESRLNDRIVHAWVADPNVKDEHKENAWFDLPAAEDIKFNRYGELKKGPRLIQHIMTKVAPLFRDRDGGYTRIIKLDAHRLGDGADYVLLQLVGREEGPQVGGRKSTRRAIANRRAAYAAKLRKGAAAEAKAEQPVEAASGDAPAEPAAS